MCLACLLGGTEHVDFSRRQFLQAAAATIAMAGVASAGIENRVTAQETEPQNKEELYQWLAEQHTSYAEQYEKAKDKDKAIAQYELAKQFGSADAEQKIKNIDIKGKVNTKKVQKINEDYEAFKPKAIEKIYQTGIKRKDNQKEALEIFDTIWKLDGSSNKPLEARTEYFEWREIEGYLLPPAIAGAREQGRKILENASEGTEYKEEELAKDLEIDADKVHGRKSRDIIARSTLSEESAKKSHKISEATIKLILGYLGIKGPPYNTRKERATDGEPSHRISIFNDKEQFEKFKKTTEWFGVAEGVTDVHESWKSKKDAKIFGFGHFHHFTSFGKTQEDTISHYTLEDVLWRSSFYIDNEAETNSPWLYRSICYNFTWQLLGTTSTIKLLNREDKYSGDVKERTSVKPANQMRARAYELVSQNKPISANRLMRLKFDQFTVDDASMAFASAEYLIHEHKERLVKILSDEYNRKSELEKASKYELKDLLGMTPEEFDKSRDQFITENYVGYRNFKE